MKRIAIVGLLSALVLGALGMAVLWYSPAAQDAILRRAIRSRLAAVRSDLLADDALHVMLCGTGSPMPDLSRASACTAIIAAGHIVLIDAGPGSWAKLAASRLPAAAIDTVLLTHLHSDHIGGLGEIAMQTWVAGRKTPLEVFGPGAPHEPQLPRDAEQHVYGTVGTEAVVAGFAAAYDADDAFRLIHHGADYLAPEGARIVAHTIAQPPADGSTVVFDDHGLRISAFVVNHQPVDPAYGYRIEYRGRVAVVSGDTVPVPNMVRMSDHADLLVHEALDAYLVGILAEALDQSGNARLAKMARDTIGYHTTPVRAAAIARQAHVRMLVLSHLVPPLPNALARHAFMRGVADARGDGETILGYDGLMITMPAESETVTTSDLI